MARKTFRALCCTRYTLPFKPVPSNLQILYLSEKAFSGSIYYLTFSSRTYIIHSRNPFFNTKLSFGHFFNTFSLYCIFLKYIFYILYIELFLYLVYAFSTTFYMLLICGIVRMVNMILKKLNDRQIRCILESVDLSERGINLLELAYGSEKAKKLFKEMLQKASIELDFEAGDTPIMVEATPLPDESLSLLITKVEDPDELDTRFSKFSPSLEDEMHSFLKSLDDFKEIEGLTKIEKDIATSYTKEADDRKNKIFVAPRAFCFENLDTLIEASKHISPYYTGPSLLYKNPSSKIYYLVLLNEEVENSLFVSSCNILGEYGKKIPFFPSSKAYLDEHFELIIKDFALNKISTI